jgi:hypothetical protein
VNQGQFPTMSEDEAAPFRPGLTRLPGDHEYHFECVCLMFVLRIYALTNLEA